MLTLRSILQKKSAFKKPVSELVKLSFLNSQPDRKFSSLPIKEGWDSFTKEEKISWAVTVRFPSNAEMAYYKGIGLKSYGTGYADEAIAALEEAAKLDRRYLPFVEHELASIYHSLGQEEKAISNLEHAFTELAQQVSVGKGKDLRALTKNMLDLEASSIPKEKYPSLLVTT